MKEDIRIHKIEEGLSWKGNPERAYSKKENIAFCGYHGWHDWYLSANLNNKKSLDNY